MFIFVLIIIAVAVYALRNANSATQTGQRAGQITKVSAQKAKEAKVIGVKYGTEYGAKAKVELGKLGKGLGSGIQAFKDGYNSSK